MEEPIENSYFNWLCVKVHRVDNPTPSLTFWKLFRQLYSTEYIWLISGDDNRAEDGVELRSEFLNEARLDGDETWELAGCSVLEMLVALARRAQFNAGETVNFWFWRFLENLGIADANDASNTPPEKIDEILNIFIWRMYDEAGVGGLFPMTYPEHDQRDVEVWYQFHAYLVDVNWTS